MEKTFEPYAYVGNNPVNFVDPTGMSKEDIIFKNSKGQETGRIKSNRIKKTIVTDTELGKINYDLDKVEADLGEIIQAIGVYSEISASVGGGIHYGGGVVMLLEGEDKFKPTLFTTEGANVGVEGDIGVGIEPFVSVLNPNVDKSKYLNLKGYAGKYNGYSGSYKIVGGSITWSNENNTTDQFWPQLKDNSKSLIPAHRNNRYTWKTYSGGFSISTKKLFTKWKVGGKYIGGELKLK